MKMQFSRRLLPTLLALGVAQAVRTVALVVFAQALVGVVLAQPFPLDAATTGKDVALTHNLVWAGLALALRSLAHWGVQVLCQRAVLGEKERLRAGLLHRWAVSSRTEGEATLVATRGLNALDSYYTQFLPALINAAVAPLLIWLWILRSDWLSALIVALTLPLIPVFMALIGWYTQDKVASALNALLRLGHTFGELAQGLPVLLGLGRAAQQQRALAELDRKYHRETMGTLRVAFLSALALELIATLSVALVAVTLGVRLIDGSVTLGVGLVVLIIVGECYGPFRELGSAFHASQEGTEAAKRAEAMISDESQRSQAVAIEGGSRVQEGENPVVLRLSNLRVRYAHRASDAVSIDELVVARRGLVALAGVSGSGKSTLLGAVAGVLPATASVAGTLSVPLRADGTPNIVYVPQTVGTTESTVGAELSIYAGESGLDGIGQILTSVNLPSTPEFLAQHPARLSPGEARRLALARATLRVRATAAPVLLIDEPSAHVDQASRDVIERALVGLSENMAVVAVTHDVEILSGADVVVRLNDAPSATPSTSVHQDSHPAVNAERPASVGRSASESDTASDRHSLSAEDAKISAASEGESGPDTPSTWSLWLKLVKPWSPAFLTAALFAMIATVAAMALSALSGWLIVQASTRPPIMLLLTAIVGVRFFGLLRAVSRYVERLLTHSAILTATSRLRSKLWSALSGAILRDRGLQRSDTTLRLLVNDVDTLRDLAARLLTPAFSVLAAVVAVVITVVVAQPALTTLAAVTLVGMVVGGCLLAYGSERQALSAALKQQRRYADRLGAVVPELAVLRVNGLSTEALAELARIDSEGTAAQKRLAWGNGVASAWVLLLAQLAALIAATGASSTGDVGNLGLLVAIVLLFLALPEALAPALSAARLLPQVRLLARSVNRRLEVQDPGIATFDTPAAGAALSLEAVQVGWTENPITQPVSARVYPGQWLHVQGESGVGKSTLAAAIMGFTPAVAGTIQRGRVAWCPQESFMFDSTLRGNLAVARERDDAPSDAELFSVLERVGLDSWYESLPDGLDEPLGPRADELSGGQRQRLSVARALLTRADVYLLDEPTAHLDDAGAVALMADLRAALSDRAVVLISHRQENLTESDVVLQVRPATAQPDAALQTA